MLMKFDCFIFNDNELENLLKGRKNIEMAKKSLILYFFTLPNLSEIVDIIYLPESVFNDEIFYDKIKLFFGRIGISLNSKFVSEENLSYSCNDMEGVKRVITKYNILDIHYQVDFGKRNISKSPKHDENIINSQYNWTNIYLLYKYCNKNNIKMLVEPILSFNENSSEDYYIHMRQILWEGIDIFRKFNIKFNEISIIILPFYPLLKGVRNNDIIEPVNIGHITLRCINECLTKERMDIKIKTNIDFSILGYMRYCKYFKSHSKDNSINCVLSSYCLKDYVKNWDFKEINLGEAQNEFIKSLSAT